MSDIRKEELLNLLDKNKKLQKYLFIRGFLISDKNIDTLCEFPFYGNWEKTKIGEFWIYNHNLTEINTFQDDNGRIFFIVGHAYNPFTMEHKEDCILKEISDNYGSDNYIDKLNEITGVYVAGVLDGKKIEYFVDPAGMQSACYCKYDGQFFISSHPQLIGDLCDLKMDDFVREITEYKWYDRVMGPYLPGDLTAFKEVKRIVPSIMYTYNEKLTHRRFWFNKNISQSSTQIEYEKTIEEAANILKNNMILIRKKWNSPAISLTGGIDSNTTFAAANGLYDKYEAFSYLSAEKEKPDVEAAKRISDAFKIRYNLYLIPEDNSEIEDYDIKVKIQEHNSGYIAKRKGNESRKRFYLEENCKIDVEVKSWVSETIRGYWYKHFNRKKMPKLSPKLYRNLYKIFILNRKLAHKVDGIFKEYIEKYEYNKIPECYPVADIFFNEVTWGSWGGTNISEMKYCFDITFPFNNRKLLDLLFKVPLEKRISDKHHLDMKKYLNKDLYDMNIRVVNMKETNFRARMLNTIFTINSYLPF